MGVHAHGRKYPGTVGAAVSGLLALLLAFSVAGAGERFDMRRRMIVDEANAIGTAYLRLDLLPAERQPRLRRQFLAYVDSRIATYRSLPDIDRAFAELHRSQAIQREIWSAAIGGRGEDVAVPLVLLPALNEMFDLASTRTMMSELHPPTVVFVMLALLLFASALYTGYRTAEGPRRGWLPALGVVALQTLVLAVVVDLEYPRSGFVTEDAFDRTLVTVRDSIARDRP
jgi:hypothetical protein